MWLSIQWPVHLYADVNVKLVCSFDKGFSVELQTLPCRFVDMLSAGLLVDALDLMLLLLWRWAVLLIWLVVGSVLAGSLSAVIFGSFVCSLTGYRPAAKGTFDIAGLMECGAVAHGYYVAALDNSSCCVGCYFSWSEEDPLSAGLLDVRDLVLRPGGSLSGSFEHRYSLKDPMEAGLLAKSSLPMGLHA
ncbi:hypothetical protein Nepgr_004005 [Nepenthes gracilis]|uniref:Uncharacterized protein n=1 Tax=Nepenthes gracilis TaxID=150966 RepID=A0AAD3S0S2_NEPGR|nr:hypothetical protein Nepgr_004005 [Nepenthes gracilis]